MDPLEIERILENLKKAVCLIKSTHKQFIKQRSEVTCSVIVAGNATYRHNQKRIPMLKAPAKFTDYNFQI